MPIGIISGVSLRVSTLGPLMKRASATAGLFKLNPFAATRMSPRTPASYTPPKCASAPLSLDPEGRELARQGVVQNRISGDQFGYGMGSRVQACGVTRSVLSVQLTLHCLSKI